MLTHKRKSCPSDIGEGEQKRKKYDCIFHSPLKIALFLHRLKYSPDVPRWFETGEISDQLEAAQNELNHERKSELWQSTFESEAHTAAFFQLCDELIDSLSFYLSNPSMVAKEIFEMCGFTQKVRDQMEWSALNRAIDRLQKSNNNSWAQQLDTFRTLLPRVGLRQKAQWLLTLWWMETTNNKRKKSDDLEEIKYRCLDEDLESQDHTGINEALIQAANRIRLGGIKGFCTFQQWYSTLKF